MRSGRGGADGIRICYFASRLYDMAIPQKEKKNTDEPGNTQAAKRTVSTETIDRDNYDRSKHEIVNQGTIVHIVDSNVMEVERDDNRASVSTLQDIDPGLQVPGGSRQLNEATDATMAVSTLHDMNVGLGPRDGDNVGQPLQQGGIPDQDMHSESRLAASTLTAMNVRAQAGEGEIIDNKTSLEPPPNVLNFGGNVLSRKVLRDVLMYIWPQR